MCVSEEGVSVLTEYALGSVSMLWPCVDVYQHAGATVWCTHVSVLGVLLAECLSSYVVLAVCLQGFTDRGVCVCVCTSVYACVCLLSGFVFDTWALGLGMRVCPGSHMSF